MTSAFVHTYRGIGDTIYSIPAISELASQYDEVYGATAFPLLYRSIPNFKPLNPFAYDWGQEWVTKDLKPGYFEHVHDTKGEFFDDYNKLFDGRHRTYKVSLALQQFRPGRNMIRHCLPSCPEPESPVLHLPAYPRNMDKVTASFLNREFLPDQPKILFHHTDQNMTGEVADRACPNSVLDDVRLHLESEGFGLYDARKYDSDRPLLYSQSVLPVYHSTGWLGLCGIMALMKQSVGVVLQNSCSLLPLAQALGKPVLCLNGPCGLRLEHCTDAALPEEQRRHVFVESANRCECKTMEVECSKPKPQYPDLVKKVGEFLEML